MEEQPKHKVDLLLTILLVLVTALIFGAIGFAYGQQFTDESNAINDKSSEDLVVNPVVSPTASVKSSATADVTANWKTYTNDTDKYSVKYPSTWTVGDSNGALAINSPENQQGAYEGYAPTVRLQVFASVSDYVNNGSPAVKSTKTLYEYAKGQDIGNTLRETTLDSKSAYEYEAGGLAGSYYHVVCEYNAKVYVVQIVSDKVSLTDIEKSIISTFQFTK